MPSVFAGRARKTEYYLTKRSNFLSEVREDIMALVRKAGRKSMIPAVRFDGTSDTGEGIELAKQFPDVEFYDYTKVASRFRKKLPPNYHLTFSRSESNEKTALRLLRSGKNVAVVFRGHLPEMWKGFPVFDGDQSDARFLDPKGGWVIGLVEKGRAKKDSSGFVVEPGEDDRLQQAA
jgi:hypothetical protein